MNGETFSAVCYLVLMNHHGEGYTSAHPSYVKEKLGILSMGYNAYAFLDRQNQLLVLDYLNYWKIEWPKKIREYEEYSSDLPEKVEL